MGGRMYPVRRLDGTTTPPLCHRVRQRHGQVHRLLPTWTRPESQRSATFKCRQSGRSPRPSGDPVEDLGLRIRRQTDEDRGGKRP